MKNITVGVVFFEGVMSFLSPCFLPLIPVYLGYLSGESTSRKKYNVIKNSLGFISGFTMVFILLGAAASSIGNFLLSYRNVLNIVLGILVVIMGLFYTGIINPAFMNMEKRISYEGKKTGFTGAVLLGAAIGFGWTPCIGPILASVLALAASSNSVKYGIYLLFVYSLGIAVPFIAAAILVQSVSLKFKGIMRFTKAIKIITGIILIFTGILISSGYFERLSGLLWR